MSSFCTAKATHIFSAKKIQHICISLDVNFNKSLTNDIVSFEQLGPGWYFAHVQAEQNLDILCILKGTLLLGTAHLVSDTLVSSQ